MPLRARRSASENSAMPLRAGRSAPENSEMPLRAVQFLAEGVCVGLVSFLVLEVDFPHGAAARQERTSPSRERRQELE